MWITKVATTIVEPGSWELQQHWWHNLWLMVVLIILTLKESFPWSLGYVVVGFEPTSYYSWSVESIEIWDFSATGIDPCQMFTIVVCINIQGSNRMMLLSLGLEEAGLLDPTTTLSPELGYLPFLMQLSISPGLVNRPIPHSLGRSRNLNLFSCSWNLLIGSIL